eukprot:GHRR01031420.1.p1 GENE.GHRR01031420.1~~GHRR01031420.1.p1  ORF type:complete len:105 (+),score=22.23 GHRR01031420.1:732-1046(+)
MAYEEYIKKAVETGKRYEDLPERIRAILPLAEWTARVREICIQQGLAWNVSMATTVCSEQEYYEELVRKYKGWGRVSCHISTVQSVTADYSGGSTLWQLHSSHS